MKCQQPLPRGVLDTPALQSQQCQGGQRDPQESEVLIAVPTANSIITAGSALPGFHSFISSTGNSSLFILGICRTESLRFTCRNLILDFELCRLIPSLPPNTRLPPKKNQIEIIYCHNRANKCKSLPRIKNPTIMEIRHWLVCSLENPWKKPELWALDGWRNFGLVSNFVMLFLL